MKVVGIIQARIGSTRLPYKMMLSLHGTPIIEWVIRRARAASRLDALIVAIPVTEENDILEKHLRSLDVEIFRGSEGDVLDRFYRAAEQTEATHVVRICADNPLIAPEEIDNLIDYYCSNPCDYAYNHIPRNNRYPDGLGAEMLSAELLATMHEEAVSQHYREHCFSFVAEQPERFSIKTFDPVSSVLQRPDLKFDIDTFDDYYHLSMRDFTPDITPDALVQLFGEEK